MYVGASGLMDSSAFHPERGVIGGRGTVEGGAVGTDAEGEGEAGSEGDADSVGPVLSDAGGDSAGGSVDCSGDDSPADGSAVVSSGGAGSVVVTSVGSGVPAGVSVATGSPVSSGPSAT